VPRTARTPDGRVLAIEEAGDPEGRPVLVHNGTPNSRHLYPPHAIDAAVRGLRLISYDRPGYGGSTPQPGRSVADCAADVRAICPELGIDRLAMWGISGGGPHVLACAALLPDLVTAAASLASPAPLDAEGLDWFEGMGDYNAEDIRLYLRDPAAARTKLESDREDFLAASPAELTAALQALLSPADAAVLKDALADYLVYCNREGLAPGSQGWWEDGVAHTSPWGFDVRHLDPGPADAWPARQVRAVRPRSVARRADSWGRGPAVRPRRPSDPGRQPHPRGARLAGRATVTRWAAGPRPT
jgi:pimeloyl-ACP methyl ester carboxylesterase